MPPSSGSRWPCGDIPAPPGRAAQPPPHRGSGRAHRQAAHAELSSPLLRGEMAQDPRDGLLAPLHGLPCPGSPG